MKKHSILALIFSVSLPFSHSAMARNSDEKDGAITFVKISAAGKSFMMGSPSSEQGRDYDEFLVQKVLDEDFEMSESTVTQLQWVTEMGSNPSLYKSQKFCEESYVDGMCPNHPVERVNYYDVELFMKKLNKKDSCDYRLPTEIEFEYAARADTVTPFYFGADASKMDENAWTESNAEYTNAVCTKAKNPFGLCDMAGNVHQWTSSIYAGTPHLITRGGSFTSKAKEVRSAHREPFYPYSRWGTLGFRVVRTCPPR
jgi:formylglycine-generating enzyme required for sulfatase activity